DLSISAEDGRRVRLFSRSSRQGGFLGTDRRNPCQSGRIADQRRHLRKPVLLCSDGFSARYDAHIDF
ncbi:unnamed protein product, partial [Musa acuminata subsp. burmannicoides]